MTNDESSSKPIRCDKCNYEWMTISENKFTICPHCYRSIRNPHFKPLKFSGEKA